MAYVAQDRLAKNVTILAEIGLPLATQPKHEPPEFPEDVSALSPLDVSNLLITYTSWYAYAASMEAFAAAEANMLKGQLDGTSAKIYLSSSLKTVEDRKMAKFNELEYVRLNQEYLEAAAKEVLLKSITSRYDKYVWALSRCLTTLGAEQERGKY